MPIEQQLRSAKEASREIGMADNDLRQALLRDIAAVLRENADSILEANARDLSATDPADPMRDRLLLTIERIDGIARDCEAVAGLPDPIGQDFDERTRGDLAIWRRRVPFGVIGIIYESRPNVTVDVATLCLRSGNAVVLKGGSEARHSNEAFVRIMRKVLELHHISPAAITLLDSGNRDLVTALITARGYVDLLIPRGGAGLIAFVRENATVPCIETGAGVCHLFVDDSADISRSVPVIVNAKTQRPSVCNALDTLLVHEAVAADLFRALAPELLAKGVEIFADADAHALLRDIYPSNLLLPAGDDDFGREFLSLRLAVKIVPSLEAALAHIAQFSSQHSEVILSETSEHQDLFLQTVDAAAVYVNASSRFTDGGQFGLGCEVGISTQKMHARGPMGLEALTTYKWLGRGQYSVRS